MSKKQIRVSFDNLSGYVNAEDPISVIQKSGSVILARLLSVSNDILKVKNTRGQKMDLPLAQIAEIWADEKVTS